jgi:hypothetical protein
LFIGTIFTDSLYKEISFLHVILAFCGTTETNFVVGQWMSKAIMYEAT